MVNTWNDDARRFYDRLGARPHDSVVYRMYPEISGNQPEDRAADGDRGGQGEHDRDDAGGLPRGVDAADQETGHRDQADDGQLLGHEAEA
jgi:hypothetical protein